jgi:hypothetical protein
MESLSRSPTKAEAIFAAVLSLIATSAFGSVALFLWLRGPAFSPVATAIFTTFFLASAFLLLRAAFSNRRALSGSEASALAWALTVAGSCGAVAALLFTSDWGRGSLLASSLSCLAYGLGTLRRPGR